MQLLRMILYQRCRILKDVNHLMMVMMLFKGFLLMIFGYEIICRAPVTLAAVSYTHLTLPTTILV